MTTYNSSAKLVHVIVRLYDKVTSTVIFCGSEGNWFRNTIEMRHTFSLSPTFFNTFLERIMAEAFADHEGNVSIGCSVTTNITYDIAGIAREESKLKGPVDRLDKTNITFKMEIIQEKTKVMASNQSEWHQTSDSKYFKYLGYITFEQLAISYLERITNEAVLSRLLMYIITFSPWSRKPNSDGTITFHVPLV